MNQNLTHTNEYTETVADSSRDDWRLPMISDNLLHAKVFTHSEMKILALKLIFFHFNEKHNRLYLYN